MPRTAVTFSTFIAQSVVRRLRMGKILAMLLGAIVSIIFLSTKTATAAIVTASVRNARLGTTTNFLRTSTGVNFATAEYSGPGIGVRNFFQYEFGFVEVEAQAEILANGALDMSLYGRSMETPGEPGEPGFNATVVWRDEFIAADSNVEEVYFVYGVHAEFDSMEGKVFGLGGDATIANRPYFDHFIGDFNGIVSSGWTDFTLAADSFEGTATIRAPVQERTAQLVISFWTSGDGFFDARNTATLLAVTDQDGNAIEGTFASGMLAQNQIAAPAPVPEPSTFAVFGLGALGVVALRRRRRSA